MKAMRYACYVSDVQFNQLRELHGLTFYRGPQVYGDWNLDQTTFFFSVVGNWCTKLVSVHSSLTDSELPITRSVLK